MIPVIPKREELLDRAFGRASRRVSGRRFRGSNVEKAIEKEVMRIDIAGNILSDSLFSIMTKTFSFEELEPFYQELVSLLIDVRRFKESLKRMKWAAGKILELKKEYISKVKGSRTTDQAREQRVIFYGRLNSILKDIEDEMNYLRECRRALKKLPKVKKMDTVVIAGCPNVGKSSLLAALTGSKPEIQSYPFTTKGILLGYRDDIQFVDTPGLLDRPFEKRNPIEKQAVSAVKHLADLILYVYDTSETCGYTLEEQEHLHHQIEKLGVPIIPVENKSDLSGKSLGFLRISCKSGEGVEELFHEIKKRLYSV
ncbi:MAG: GTP-binding protein [Candidatus Aenigmatarchaeota archaeon]|nr:MAG: GTP-binding protein [Candidatus Aenigmarchaeota archaeon]